MNTVNRDKIWTVIRWMIYSGVVCLFLVSIQRVSNTPTEINNQLEKVKQKAIDSLEQKSQQPTVIADTTRLLEAGATPLKAAQTKPKSIRKHEQTDQQKIEKLEKRLKAHAIQVYYDDLNQRAGKYLVTLGMALLISSASFCAGGFAGFLFGIPRTINSTSDTTLLPMEKTLIFHNDNLVQISDWLTKIIVGVSLTQVGKIPEILDNMGEYLSPSFNPVINNMGGGVDPTSKTIAISAVIYFTILGFMTSYLWTRFYFLNMLHETLDKLSSDGNHNPPAGNAPVNPTPTNPLAGTVTSQTTTTVETRSAAPPQTTDPATDATATGATPPATDPTTGTSAPDTGTSSTTTDASSDTSADPPA